MSLFFFDGLQIFLEEKNAYKKKAQDVSRMRHEKKKEISEAWKWLQKYVAPKVA